MDDPFITCPYDHSHRVPRSRIQAHIVRCQEKHPPLTACPYNATHRFTQADMKIHVTQCPSREEMFPEDKPPKVVAHLIAPRPILQREYLPETDPNHETWDD
ncbi:gametocyte-specific factor 1-like [Vanessa atalanta]|uniref:gametocyte-specific factor 1-like n=1 Tax=Vanessa atalanta TaxID=42275 RepID=UPI001FCD30CA|nr:gametocyte-specific factor 1-like [Vanessa atalanta]